MSCGAALERSQELAERQFDLVIEALGVDLAGRQRYGPRHHALALDPDRLAPLGRGFAPSRKEPSHHPAQQNSKKRHGDGQRQNGAARYLAALRSCRLVGPDDRRSGWRVVCAVGVDAARVLDGRRRFLRSICRRRLGSHAHRRARRIGPRHAATGCLRGRIGPRRRTVGGLGRWLPVIRSSLILILRAGLRRLAAGSRARRLVRPTLMCVGASLIGRGFRFGRGSRRCRGRRLGGRARWFRPVRRGRRLRRFAFGTQIPAFGLFDRIGAVMPMAARRCPPSRSGQAIFFRARGTPAHAGSRKNEQSAQNGKRCSFRQFPLVIPGDRFPKQPPTAGSQRAGSPPSSERVRKYCSENVLSGYCQQIFSCGFALA